MSVTAIQFAQLCLIQRMVPVQGHMLQCLIKELQVSQLHICHKIISHDIDLTLGKAAAEA